LRRGGDECGVGLVPGGVGCGFRGLWSFSEGDGTRVVRVASGGVRSVRMGFLQRSVWCGCVIVVSVVWVPSLVCAVVVSIFS